MAPARWVDGQWQNVTISKSNPSSAVRFVRDESGPPPPAEPLSGTYEVHPQLEDPGPNASLTDWTRYVLVCSERLREHPPDDAPPRSMEKFSVKFIDAVRFAGCVICKWRQSGRRLVNCKHSGSAKSIVLHGQWFRWKSCLVCLGLHTVDEFKPVWLNQQKVASSVAAGSLSWQWQSARP